MRALFLVRQAWRVAPCLALPGPLWWFRRLGGGSPLRAFVARLDGSPIGSCVFVRNEIDPAHDLTPWLARLVVDEAYRGQGVGTALVRAVEAHAASAVVGMLYLYTWEARPFYEALGRTAVDAFEQDGEPMLLMERSL